MCNGRLSFLYVADLTRTKNAPSNKNQENFTVCWASLAKPESGESRHVKKHSCDVSAVKRPRAGVKNHPTEEPPKYFAL